MESGSGYEKSSSADNENDLSFAKDDDNGSDVSDSEQCYNED